jgi:hypothetical protein
MNWQMLKENMMTKMTVFELMMLRYEWEEIARGFRNVNQNGTLDSLQQFLDRGAVRNRFRDGFDRATEIANIIIEQAKLKNEEIDLSGLRGEEVEAV